jgi:hypothetical protein
VSDCQQDYDDLKEATTKQINALNHRVVELMRELDEERKYSGDLVRSLMEILEPVAQSRGFTGSWHIVDVVRSLAEFYANGDE